MRGLEDYEKGDRIRVLRYGATDSHMIGKEGRVTRFDREYVVAILDADEDSLEVYFLPSEVEPVLVKSTVTEPVVEDDTFDPDDYGIRMREYEPMDFGNCFEFFHKESGKVLLTTQFVSLSTLMLIAQDHKEGNR